MRVTMTTTEAVYKRGQDSAPTMARNGKTYDFPDDVAADLVTSGKATAADPTPEPQAPAPSRRKVTGPSETK